MLANVNRSHSAAEPADFWAMRIVCFDYWRADPELGDGAPLLDAEAHRALEDAVDQFDDHVIIAMQEGINDELDVDALALPEQNWPEYDVAFLRRFYLCFLRVVEDLASERWSVERACRAEELAFWGVVHTAQMSLLAETAGTDEDEARIRDRFGPFIDAAFEDTDFLFCFDPTEVSYGDHGTATDKWGGFGSLRIEDWFRPFNDDRKLHPLLSGNAPVLALDAEHGSNE